MVKIRAKTVLKLDTGRSTVDYEYPKGMPIEEVAKDILHAVVQNKGTAGAKEFVASFLGEYEADYPGIVTPNAALTGRGE